MHFTLLSMEFMLLKSESIMPFIESIMPLMMPGSIATELDDELITELELFATDDEDLAMLEDDFTTGFADDAAGFGATFSTIFSTTFTPTQVPGAMPVSKEEQCSGATQSLGE
jgi:hypothetical protein